MALHLKVSNILEGLLGDMIPLLQAQKGNVFAPTYIITQTDGMNVWLRQQLAQHLGIVAHTQFLKPNDLIAKVYALLGGTFETSLSKSNLVWILYQLIGSSDFLERFPEQAAYFFVSNADNDLKQMGLAEKLADLFDQYQIFRPELIQTWNQLPENDLELGWQGYLWKKANVLSKTKLPDKTVIREYILSHLAVPEKGERLQRTLPKIYLFGLSIITRYHISLLNAIAEVIDVYFYLQNPAPEIYWLDDRSQKDISLWRQRGVPHTDSQIVGNALLMSWGKVLRNTYSLLFKNEALINQYETVGLHEVPAHSLLTKIQNDIYNNHTSDRNLITKDDLHDGTVVIQSCYSIEREVDALYQYLVHTIAQNPNAYSSRDIVVMVADIDLYAPYIKAVFENGAYHFRFKIADTSVANGDNILSALQEILLLNEDNLSAEAVLKLLESAVIRARFEIYDIAQIRTLVAAANIRFGIKGRVADETELISWHYGLQRMMYGICMSGSEAYPAEPSFYPLDIIEGTASLELIRFCHFVQVLFSAIQERRKKRNIEDWVKYIQELLTNLLFDPNQNNTDQFAHFNALNESLASYAQVYDFITEPISFDLFSRNLIQVLSSEQNSGLFAHEGITFCSLIPMRSIPFKIVAMLGLNDMSFPRKERKLHFNLMHLQAELGDRNVKDNDKHLFLETLLSAKQQLYISYLGRLATDNSILAPSILVAELVTYIEAGMSEREDWDKNFIQQQPLHSFSKRYNQEGSPLYRYTALVNKPKFTLVDPSKELILPDNKEIQWKDILAFYKNAIKVFYNKRLSIYYTEQDELIPETEVFALDGLQKWQLKSRLLQTQLGLAELRDQWVKQGLLPLKQIANLSLRELEQELAPYQFLYQKHTGYAEPKTLSFEISLGNTTVLGSIPNVYQGRCVQVNFANRPLKAAIDAYLYALVGVVTGQLQQVVLIHGKDNPKDYVLHLNQINTTDALQRLTEIVKLYQNGILSMMPFIDLFYEVILKSEDWTEDLLRQILTAKLNDFMLPYDDAYVLQAKRYGFFEQDGWAAALRQVKVLLLDPVKDLFPYLIQ